MGTRVIRSVVSAIAVCAVLVALSPSVSAESGVWHQAFERTSEDAACLPPSNETAWQDSFRGQREWTPSWAQWANGGQGGWVCQRSIVWANTANPLSVGCVLGTVDSPPFYWNFRGGFSLPVLTEAYSDPDCQVLDGGWSNWDIVYVPAGYDPEVLCQQAFGTRALRNGGPNIWQCSPF